MQFSRYIKTRAHLDSMLYGTLTFPNAMEFKCISIYPQKSINAITEKLFFKAAS